METKVDLQELEEYLYARIAPVVSSWGAPDAYAVSFFLYTNEAYIYKGRENVVEFSVGFVTERDCDFAPPESEERWNLPPLIYNTPILQPNNISPSVPALEDEGMEFLFDWYRRHGIDNIGDEDLAGAYDEHMNYIGKGPTGYYEVLVAASRVARRLQEEGAVRAAFGKPLPIIVHAMELYGLMRDVTAYANPHGEIKDFLAYYDAMVREAQERYAQYRKGK